MADTTDRKRLTRMQKLLEDVSREYERIGEALDELRDLAGGGNGVGPVIAQLETTFDALWGARYAQGALGKYIWAYQKDRPQMKKLIRTLGAAEVERRMRAYHTQNDEFSARVRHSFPIFVATINSYAKAADLADFDLDAGPIGCTHTPTCKTDVEHTRRKLNEARQ